MVEKLENDLKKIKKQQFTAISIIVALTCLLIFFFLIFLQETQIQNITQKFSSNIELSTQHIVKSQASKNKLLLQNLLNEKYFSVEIKEVCDEIKTKFNNIQKQNKYLKNLLFYDKQGRLIHVVEKVQNKNELSKTILSNQKSDESQYLITNDNNGNYAFKVVEKVGDSGYMASIYDLDLITHNIQEIIDNQSYFLQLKSKVDSAYEFEGYQIVSKLDRFLTSFIDSHDDVNRLKLKSQNLIYNHEEKSYIVSIVDMSEFSDIKNLAILSFEDITFLTQKKEQIFAILTVGLFALVIFIISLFLSYLQINYKKFKELFTLHTKGLQEEKTKFENYYKKAPVPIITFDDDRVIGYANDKFLELVGYESKNVITRDLLDFVLPQEHKTVKTALSNTIENDCHDSVEFTLYHKNAKKVSVKMSARMLDMQSNITQATFLNITKDVQLREMLVQKEAYIKAIFDAEPEILVVTNGFEITMANRSMLEFFGVNSLKEFKEKHSCICEVFVPNRGYLHKFMDEESWIEYILHHNDQTNKALMYKDSVLHTFSVNARQITNQDNDEFASIVVFTDITEDEEKKIRYEFALEGSSDGIWDVDLISKQVYFSPRWKQMIGYKDEEIENLADEWWDRIHPDDLIHVKDNLEECLTKHINKYENIHRIKHKNGSWVWVYSHGNVIFDEEQQPIRMVGVHTDITSLKHQQFELEKLNTVLDYSPFGVMITNEKGVVTYANKHIEVLMGYTQKELQQTRIADYVVENEANKAVMQELYQKVENDEVFRGAFEVKRKDGSIYLEHNIIAPVVIKGESRSYIGIKQVLHT